MNNSSHSVSKQRSKRTVFLERNEDGNRSRANTDGEFTGSGSGLPSPGALSPSARSAIMLALSLLLLFLALLFPAHPARFELANWQRLPLELPAIVLCLLLLTRWPALRRALITLLVPVLLLLLLLRLGDLGSRLAFNRRFSPLLEWHLLADGWHLASTSIGPMQASLVVGVVLLLLALVAVLLHRALRTIAYSSGWQRRWLGRASLVCLLIGALAILVQARGGMVSPFQARVLPEVQQRIAHIIASVVDQRQFVAELQTDTLLDNTTPTFAALAGRDVILIFVESYGRSYVSSDLFAERAHDRLTQAETRLREAGLHALSGWMTSPIRGGRSWMAHSTLQSGLHIDNQARFDRLISSDRRSLTRLFSDAGWRTAGIKPAIESAWPEGSWYGFESLAVKADMGYAGKRFGYATMPDQYTLSWFERSVRQADEQPLMAMIALLSTHGPWSPVPRKLDWELIGDGSIYDGSHRMDEPISWRYRKRVQEMYALTFDYTLDIISDYAARYADDALLIVVGDHQPSPVINGWGPTYDVPIHIITEDADLLQRLPEQLWTEGMIPSPDVPSQPMKTWRETLSTLFEVQS